MSKPNITVQRGLNSITIFVGGTPHLRFAVETYIGFQSWLWTEPRGSFERLLSATTYYEIEIYFSNAPAIRLGYDDRSMWETILKLLLQA